MPWKSIRESDWSSARCDHLAVAGDGGRESTCRGDHTVAQCHGVNLVEGVTIEIDSESFSIDLTKETKA
jgi:hypothetical protein